MANIITAVEFIEFRNVSKKQDTDKVDECIKLAEQSDFIKVLGDFYFDVVENKDSAEWADLMNGSSFIYNDERFIHLGLKKMLADLAYSRYSYKKNVNDTSFGMVTKNYQDGTPIDRNFTKDISNQAQVDASSKFVYIEKYILSKPVLFSRYCKNKKEATSFNGVRFSKL
jgi:hypothetical protein